MRADMGVSVISFLSSLNPSCFVGASCSRLWIRLYAVEFLHGKPRIAQQFAKFALPDVLADNAAWALRFAIQWILVEAVMIDTYMRYCTQAQKDQKVISHGIIQKAYSCPLGKDRHRKDVTQSETIH